MDVKDRLAGVRVAVEDRAKARVGVAVRGGEGRAAPDHLADEPVVIGREIVQRGDMLARYDQDVKRRLRRDVGERDQMRILVEHVRRNLAANDSTEKTAVHRRDYRDRAPVRAIPALYFARSASRRVPT